MKYKVGDRVRIVNKRTGNMNFKGRMDKYLGTIMTISSVHQRSYSMIEDSERWSWDDDMIEGLVFEITLTELKNRGLKIGDFIKFDYSRAWYLVLTDKLIVPFGESLFIENLKNINLKSIEKMVKIEDIYNHEANCIDVYTDYNEDGDLNWFQDIITKVHTNYTMCITGVHFGNPKEYIWKVPEKLEGSIDVGQVVEVDTFKGTQLVMVKSIFLNDNDANKHKEVISIW